MEHLFRGFTFLIRKQSAAVRSKFQPLDSTRDRGPRPLNFTAATYSAALNAAQR